VASRLDARWEPSLAAPRSKDRRAGHFRPYLPDPLMTRPVVLDAELGAHAAKVESAVRSLVAGPGARGLEGLARFLLRSEAIASSRIEGLHPGSCEGHYKGQKWRSCRIFPTTTGSN
jgi:hypothetical protein